MNTLMHPVGFLNGIERRALSNGGESRHPTDRHNDTAHYLYVDGHVDVIAAAQINEWIDAGYEFAKPE